MLYLSCTFCADSKTVDILPPTWPLEIIAKALLGNMRDTMATERKMKIKKGLAKSENLQVSRLKKCLTTCIRTKRTCMHTHIRMYVCSYIHSFSYCTCVRNISGTHSHCSAFTILSKLSLHSSILLVVSGYTFV